jgi:hypothetical protein
MFKKLNTKTLIILLVVFGGLVLFNKFYHEEKSESTFRDVFVKIDTSIVTQIQIYPQAEKGKEIKLIKNGAKWELQNDKMKTAADSNAVHGLLAAFSEMKSLSLGGTDKSSWTDLQVTDSAGTRIIFTTADNKTYNMVIGKFGYNNETRQGNTYIRHSDEEAVYSVEGFLSFSVNQGFNSWRNKILVHGDKNNWTQLMFTYPDDSSFVLSKQGTAWTVNGAPADSAKTEQYLSGLANMQSVGFADNYSPSSTPAFTLSISGNNISQPITVQAYPADSTQKFIYHSSLNPDTYFSEAQSNIMSRLFVGREHFLQKQETGKQN